MSTLFDNYARATLQAAGSDARTVEQALLVFVAQMEQSAELSSALMAPVLHPVQRQQLIDALGQKMGLPLYAVNLIKVMARKGRMKFLPKVVEQLTKLVDQQEGVVAVDITTARELDAAERQSFESKLTLGKKTRFRWHSDASLLGGAVVRMGDAQWDGSIRRRLNDLRHQLSLTQAG